MARFPRRRLQFISAILLSVRKASPGLILLPVFATALLVLTGWGQSPAQTPTAPAPPTATPPQGAPPAPQLQAPPALSKPTLSTAVLDPAHGGADAGARGPNAVLESEVVLSLANQVRAELERQGLRVLLTRQGNENSAFDDRSAVVNAQRGALFISLHVSSTGPVGTVRAYSLPPASHTSRPATAAATEHASLVPWDHAQDSYTDLSRRLAELVQIQLAQKFRGSPEVPATAPVRQLRTIAAPAIAIEVSSVAVSNRGQLEQMGPALAEAVTRSIAAFRSVYEAGAK